MTEAELVHRVDRLIHKLARQYIGVVPRDSAIEFSDLVAVGRLGALQAARRYDLSVGYNQYGWYALAHSYIRARIIDEIRAHSYPLRMPREFRVPGTIVRDHLDGHAEPYYSDPFLRKAVASLPGHYRTIIEEVYWKESKRKDIEQLVTLAPTSINHAEKRALARLRDILTKDLSKDCSDRVVLDSGEDIDP